MVLERTKYVGTRRGSNIAQIRMNMLGRSDAGSHADLWMAHDTDVPSRDAFPIG